MRVRKIPLRGYWNISSEKKRSCNGSIVWLTCPDNINSLAFHLLESIEIEMSLSFGNVFKKIDIKLDMLSRQLLKRIYKVKRKY